ncbi:hypothetical protein ABZ801_35855 [Actinomadura sp. NPDC047616]|uniref:hypothetical protein n=1 Tax=Actinomadura sp. NPDC047616 TaxID=3155914 RepID=UPI0034039105
MSTAFATSDLTHRLNPRASNGLAHLLDGCQVGSSSLDATSSGSLTRFLAAALAASKRVW